MYEIPTDKKSIDQNRFPFKIGTKTYHLPKLKFITGLQYEKLVDEASPAQIIRTIADEPTAEALLALPMQHLEGLIEAWQEDSGVSLGESDSSES